MQKRTLTQLAKKVFNTPLYVTEEALAPIATYLADPDRTMKLAQLKDNEPVVEKLLRSDFPTDEEYKRYALEDAGINPDTMIGTVNISGTLVNRAGQTQACVELTSYEKLKKQFESQIALGAERIVMQIDSGGGEAYRLFGTANAVKKLANSKGVKLIAYIDGTSASAAYGWASIADEIIVNPMGRAGSVGVVVQLYNDSKMLEKMGYERSFVYAGKNKIPFDDKGAFTESFIKDLQISVDKSYVKFTEFIATNRSMSVEDVVNTNAKVFDAEEALSVGFVDKIMEIEEFEEYLVQNQSQSQHKGLQMADQNAPVVSLEDLTKAQADAKQAQEQLSTLQTSFDEQATALATANESLQTLQSNFDVVAKEKAELEATIATMKADAIVATRTQQLEAVLGTENDQVATLLASTQSLDDTSFNAIVSAMEAKEQKEVEQLEEKGKQAQQADLPDPMKEAMKLAIARTA